MNGFLVLLCHTMDDLPIGLHADEESAIRQADTVDPMPNGNVRDVFGTDASTPICVKVVQFSNGVPVDIVHHRDLED